MQKAGLGGAIAMASKTLSVHDDRRGFQPRRTPAVDLRVSGEAERSAMAFLPPIISPNEDYRLRYLQTDLLGSENYQVALVPPATTVPRFRIGASETVSPILLLPITWKGLIARVGAEEDHPRSLQHSAVLFGAV